MALAGAFTSCDSYLDINDNPNAVTVSQVSAGDIFPGCEGAFMNIYGGTWNYMGAFQSWMYAQSGAVWQWGQIARGDVTNTTATNGYDNVYRNVLSNAALVMEKAEASEDWGTYLAAVTLRVAALQMIVDAIGDAPYSEAIDLTNQTPKYDKAEDIYKGLVEEIDYALAKPIATGSLTCTNFLLGASATGADWIKVANAVKLKVLMRENGVVDVKNELSALMKEDNFPTSDVAWKGIFAKEQYKCNPFWGQFTDTGNRDPWVQMNIASQKVYESAGDARMQVYFKPTEDGSYVGWLSGCYPGNQFAQGYKDLTKVSGANLHYDDPVYLITVAEIEFFKAEYEARYGSASAAKTHYENAIKASFSKTAGLSEADAAGVIAAWPYDQNNWAKSIGIQKWIHLTGVNGFEGWCELRRLKYPAFGVSGDQLIKQEQNATYNLDLLEAGTIYTTPSWERDAQLPANTVIQRWITPDSSAKNNPNAPAPVAITVPLFWAK